MSWWLIAALIVFGVLDFIIELKIVRSNRENRERK
jgi:hypothetical protein